MSRDLKATVRLQEARSDSRWAGIEAEYRAEFVGKEELTLCMTTVPRAIGRSSDMVFCKSGKDEEVGESPAVVDTSKPLTVGLGD